MKKLIFTFLMCMFCFHAFSSSTPSSDFGGNLTFQVGNDDPIGAGIPLPKSPVQLPQATLENHVLTFTSTHPAYTLRIVDANGDTVYQVAIPDNVSIIVLPGTLIGSYELQLFPGNGYYYYSDIIL